ncbi:MAG: HD domain-containing protein [Acholeplasmataceae bacterium]|jgi:uncharacterized protein|nr:HD domain-containing protein [Acholeplasmataceae bacterium]
MKNNKLIAYLNKEIIPIYDSFDHAHQKSHVFEVINDSIHIAKDYDTDLDMVYTIACYHDIGIQFGRENHHITGGLFLFNDKNLSEFFSHDQLITMKEAVEDHRASSKNPPRSIYGKIIAEADRQIDLESICVRTIQFGLKHYPDINQEEHIARAINHLHEKYGINGYLNLWLRTKRNEDGLKKIQELLKDEDKMKAFLKDLYFQQKK